MMGGRIQFREGMRTVACGYLIPVRSRGQVMPGKPQSLALVGVREWSGPGGGQVARTPRHGDTRYGTGADGVACRDRPGGPASHEGADYGGFNGPTNRIVLTPTLARQNST